MNDRAVNGMGPVLTIGSNVGGAAGTMLRNAPREAPATSCTEGADKAKRRPVPTIEGAARG